MGRAAAGGGAQLDASERSLIGAMHVQREMFLVTTISSAV